MSCSLGHYLILGSDCNDYPLQDLRNPRIIRIPRQDAVACSLHGNLEIPEHNFFCKIGIKLHFLAFSTKILTYSHIMNIKLLVTTGHQQIS